MKATSKPQIAPPTQDPKILKTLSWRLMGAMAFVIQGVVVKSMVEQLQIRYPGVFDQIDPNQVSMVAQFGRSGEEFSEKAILLNEEDAATVVRMRKNTLDKIKTPPDDIA